MSHTFICKWLLGPENFSDFRETHASPVFPAISVKVSVVMESSHWSRDLSLLAAMTVSRKHCKQTLASEVLVLGYSVRSLAVAFRLSESLKI